MNISSDHESSHSMSKGQLLACTSGLLIELILTGCQGLPANEGVPASVAKVLAQIKEDVGIYQVYEAGSPKDALDNVCKGAVEFRIESVRVSLTTKSDEKVEGSAGVTLPIGPVTVGPAFSASQEIVGTQNLTFSIYPRRGTITPAVAANKIDANLYPIAANLKRLREGLLEASNKTPCVSLTPLPDGDKTPDDPGGTFEFGFAVINTGVAEAKVTFVIFSLGASNTSQRQASNTITVTFKAQPGGSAAAIM